MQIYAFIYFYNAHKGKQKIFDKVFREKLKKKIEKPIQISQQLRGFLSYFRILYDSRTVHLNNSPLDLLLFQFSQYSLQRMLYPGTRSEI